MKREKDRGRISLSPVIILVFILMTGTIWSGYAQEHTKLNNIICGIWQGAIKTSGFELQMIFTISRNTDSLFIATLDVPEQNATGIPVDKILIDSNSVHLEITPIEGVFSGNYAKDGETIDGQWSQGGMSLPLVLKRSDTKFVIKRPQEPKEPFPYSVEEVVFKNTDANITLAGTFTFPQSEGTFPAVLLLSGSGPQDRDETVFGHRPFFVLADYLTRRGIAVLRVDDRGIGGSTGDFDQATAIDFTSDAIAGVNYLRNRKEINQEKIGLIGHSEGGMIAPMVAVKTPSVAFMVLIASPGLAIREMEHSERARDLKSKGAGEDLIARERILLENLFEVIMQETDSAAVKKRFDMIIRESFEGLSEKERNIIEISEQNLEACIHEQFIRLHSKWFRYYLTYDPGKVLENISIPVLAVNGEKDIQVPARKNLRAIKTALEAGGNKDYTIKELPNLNHLLQTAETGNISEYAKIEETISPVALQVITDWILEVTASR
jgi:fermentation-respiration switch protein FrsA (DUF1100 family)